MTPNEPEKRSRGPQPDGLFVSASEALTWLAFGVPEKQAWRRHNVAERLRRRIGVQALWIDPYAVGRELASRVRSGEAGEHEKASLTILTEALKAHAARQTALRAAAARLMDALVRRDFSAWGRKDKGFMQPDYGARRVEIPWEDIAEDGVTLTLHDRLQQEPDLLVGGINRGPGYGDVRFLASDIDALLAKYASDRADSSSAAAASSDAPVLPRPAGTDRGVAFSAPGDSAQAQQRGADPAWETVIASSPPKDQETLRVMRAVAEEQLAKTMHRVKRDELARVVGTKGYSVGRARQLYRLLPEHLRNLARTAGARTR